MITPVLKIACDLCGEFRHKTAVSGAAPPMPSAWHQTTNRGVQGPDYCLDGVEIICDSCHEKLTVLVAEIRKAARDRYLVGEQDQPPPEKHTVTAKLDGQPIYFDGQKWRHEDTGEPVNPPPAEELPPDLPGDLLSLALACRKIYIEQISGVNQRNSSAPF